MPAPTGLSNDSAAIVAITQSLLDAIFRGDWVTYTQICAEDITAIEPEGRGHLIQGLPFHQTYFPVQPRNPKTDSLPTVTISSPHVRVMGDAAVIAYVRLVQSRDSQGSVTVSATEETRVWQRVAGDWKHVHFHRSPIA
jgi:ketosteroid isomerase-like protein